MRGLIILLLGVLLISVEAVSQKVYSPQDMPNVQVADRSQYISDPGNLLSAETKEMVNHRLADLRQQTTAEIVVALPPDIGDTPIEEWSEQLFTLWGIGKSDKDNGLLIVIAPEQRKARIQTGYGMEGVLPDISCKNIIGKAIVPAMREGDIDAAVNNSTTLIAEAVTDPAVAEELRSDEADNYEGAMNTISSETIWGFIRIVSWCVFLFALFCFCRDLYTGRKLDNYRKAMLWREHLPTFFWCSLLSMGAGLIFFILAFWFYRSIRTKKRKCPTCGHKMRRLNEEEDNVLLTPSQDFEERLKTVDYDVWECPECGTVERLPFKAKQLRYTPCPSCGTIAMGLSGSRVLVPPTTRSAGQGVKTYECKFCHHREEKPYIIPKKDDGAAAALAAGAILGSMGSGRRGGGGGFGGGGFGGGFGGGSTGGGGASGGW
ncbi:MAG: TPM domain-containing protein [Muribaculaceae bacterium]|nr:TPM domain-containing protein [Muribaculaceae bacterium]